MLWEKRGASFGTVASWSSRPVNVSRSSVTCQYLPLTDLCTFGPAGTRPSGTSSSFLLPPSKSSPASQQTGGYQRVVTGR